MDDEQAKRPDTAVSPVIRGESVHVPTPVWGALARDDVETITAEIVDTDEQAALEGDGRGELLARPRRLLGWLSLAAFVVTAVLHGLAVSVAAYQDLGAGTVLAWFAIIASVAAIGLGITAAVLDRGRTLGIVGAVGGLLANPWVVLQVLRLLSP